LPHLEANGDALVVAKHIAFEDDAIAEHQHVALQTQQSP
jgi:hypothetical protein